MSEASGPHVDVPLKTKTSDLGVRTASAVVMLAVAGGALWLDGVWLDAVIALVALACLAEFVMLVSRATPNLAYRVAAILVGAFYIGLAALTLMRADVLLVLAIIGAVVAIDTGAYFAGRAIGGPKIAPGISPSKTWAGLMGGMVGGAIWLMGCALALTNLLVGSGVAVSEQLSIPNYALAAGIGAGLAIVAQAGDFFESWLKRRAGVKDSSRLIPGHGGVFDRVDGLLAVALVLGLLDWFSS
jgi:phosphatidate cytidylyltransferase